MPTRTQSRLVKRSSFIYRGSNPSKANACWMRAVPRAPPAPVSSALVMPSVISRTHPGRAVNFGTQPGGRGSKFGTIAFIRHETCQLLEGVGQPAGIVPPAVHNLCLLDVLTVLRQDRRPIDGGLVGR